MFLHAIGQSLNQGWKAKKMSLFHSRVHVLMLWVPYMLSIEWRNRFLFFSHSYILRTTIKNWLPGKRSWLFIHGIRDSNELILASIEWKVRMRSFSCKINKKQMSFWMKKKKKNGSYTLWSNEQINTRCKLECIQ